MTTLLTLSEPWQLFLVFVAGLIVGIAMGVLIFRAKGENTRLQTQINKLETELNNYRSKINEHFSTTAQMINQLTENYRDIHQHLAEGASDLCVDGAVKEQFQDALISASTIVDASHHEASGAIGQSVPSVPPRDYAAEGGKTRITE